LTPIGKITEIEHVGKSIFEQKMNFVEKAGINGTVNKHESDYYYNSSKPWTLLFTMQFGILSCCHSISEVCEGLRAKCAKLNRQNLDQVSACVRHMTDCAGRIFLTFEHSYMLLTVTQKTSQTKRPFPMELHWCKYI
jgi:hypothetical protein